PVRVSLSEAGPEAVRFAVHNEGPAIPAETLPLLFDPFRRGAQTGSGRGSRGLGLGLYIAHQIVTAHGGKLEVQSSPEEGTTFTATLPRHSTSLPAAQ
ncbi:MAG: sensor histidine kinase, partial [Myxococcaceae bacterium]